MEDCAALMKESGIEVPERDWEILEELIVWFLKLCDISATRTKASWDGGKDVIARDDILVECKLYMSQAVGVKKVRDFIGAALIYGKAKHAILAAPGSAGLAGTITITITSVYI